MTDENSPAGRAMLVTGAASGFGFVMSTAFLEAGARVVLTDVGPDRARDLAATLERFADRAVYVPADLRRSEELDNLVRAVIDRFAAVNLLLHNCVDGDVGVGIRPGIAHPTRSHGAPRAVVGIGALRWHHGQTLHRRLLGPVLAGVRRAREGGCPDRVVRSGRADDFPPQLRSTD